MINASPIRRLLAGAIALITLVAIAIHQWIRVAPNIACPFTVLSYWAATDGGTTGTVIRDSKGAEYMIGTKASWSIGIGDEKVYYLKGYSWNPIEYVPGIGSKQEKELLQSLDRCLGEQLTSHEREQLENPGKYRFEELPERYLLLYDVYTALRARN